MKHDENPLKSAIGLGQKGLRIALERFESITDRLRETGRIKIADALTDARSRIMSSSHLSEDQKQQRIEALQRIGEESARKEPDNGFFTRLRQRLTLEASTPVPSDAATDLVNMQTVIDLARFVENVAEFIHDIDWSSIDIGGIDFGG